MFNKKRIVPLALAAIMVANIFPSNVMAQNSDNENATTVADANLSYADYDLKWEDNFDGDSLDRTSWNVETHDPGWVNSELQAYVDSEDNIKVEDGKLFLNPIKTVDEDGNVSYTSGRINTQHKKDFTYGLFEVRAKVPDGMGYLPAFWLMSSDENVYGQWPRCGEIDCMEVMGQDPQKLYGTIHYGNPHRESQGTFNLTGDETFANDYHTFQCEWEPGSIKWYVDGVKYHEEHDWYSTTVGQGTLAYPAPFDQPFYVILNLAVGGSWVGNPDESTSFENNPYVIDYVKVYQKDSYDENVTKPSHEVVLRDPDADGNYINNGSFAVDEDLSDDADWKFMTALSGDAVASINNETMTIETTKEGTVDYSVQLVQAGLPFEKGSTYEVSFDAYASADRSMKTAVKAPDFGYSEYMPSKTVDLTTEKQTFTYTFKMKDDSDANGRLEFNMGAAGSTADIYISNVSVKKVSQADPNEVEEKTVLADGNYVYNGRFQEGTGHLGYWDITNKVDAVNKVTSFSDGRRFKVELTEDCAEDDFVLSQSDLAFQDGSSYYLSFSAESDAEKDITVVLGGNEYKATLSTSKETYGFSVPADAVFTDKNIAFYLGGAAGTVLLDNISLVEDKLIKNGSFDAGLTGYEVYVDGSANASYVVDSLTEDNALDVTIKDTSDQDWKVQIKQNNVNLEKGKWYTLSFKAKSSLDRDIRVIMQGLEDKGWPVYSGENTVALTSDYQTFTKTFQMMADTDPNAFFSICLGKITDRITTQHRVVIDEISLVETEAPDMDTVPFNTNLLKNADFSDPADAMANWSETIATWNGTAADRTIDNGTITYDISNVGDEDWNVQLKQSEIYLENGQTYQVTFDVTSTESRYIKSGVMSTTYNWYGGSDISLNANEATPVSYTFTMNTDDSAADMYISMGKILDPADVETPASVITISNLSLIKVGETTDEPETPDTDDEIPYDTNLLKNADFSDVADAMANWVETIAVWNGTAADRTIDNGTITYDISNVGDEDWNIQLKQSGINLEKGESYRVTYDILSSESRFVKSGVMSDSYAWHGGSDYMLNANEATPVSFDFTMNENDPSANFYISLGYMNGYDTPASVVSISNLSLIKVGETTDEPEEPAHVHSFVEVAAVAPTCTEAGNSTYFTCECGKFFSAADEATEIEENSWIIGALGHDLHHSFVRASTSRDGYTGKACSRCDYIEKDAEFKAIGDVSLKYNEITYTGLAYKPAVTVKDTDGNVISSENYTVTYSDNKNVGKGIVQISFKGNYVGSLKKAFDIKPLGTLALFSCGQKNGFKITWIMQLIQTDGYEIEYSTDKTFTEGCKTIKVSNSKTFTTTVNKLSSGQKYYVHVRTYKTVNGKKYYSDYSNTMCVTTK